MAGSRALCKLSSIFSPSSMVGSRAGRGAAPPACQHSPDTPRSARPRPGLPRPLRAPSALATGEPLGSSFRSRSRCPGRARSSPDVGRRAGTGGCRAAVGGARPLTWGGPGGAFLRGAGGRGVRSHRCRGLLRRFLPARLSRTSPRPLRRRCPGRGAKRGSLDGSGEERTDLRGSAGPTAAKAHFLELIPPCPTPTPCPPLSTPLEISFLPALLPGCRHRPRHASRGRRSCPAPGCAARPGRPGSAPLPGSFSFFS